MLDFTGILCIAPPSLLALDLKVPGPFLGNLYIAVRLLE